MNDSSAMSLTCFFVRLKDGDEAAVDRLWSHFFPRLVGLAAKILKSRPFAVLDPEDAAQSAFASFWKRAARGDFASELNRNDLWRILATITVRKVRRDQTRESAEKRGGGRALHTSAFADDSGSDFRLDSALADAPLQEYDLLCEEMISALDTEELRTIAIYRLMSYTNREIAEMLGCTERKVERKLQVIRMTWQRNETEKPAL